MSTALTPEQKQARKAEAELRGMQIADGMNVLGESLTGYEEEGIAQAFGHHWTDDDLDTQSTLRALVFVLKKREGLNHADAKAAVMEMTARAVQDIVTGFAIDEAMPDEPVTEAGKGDAQPD